MKLIHGNGIIAVIPRIVTTDGKYLGEVDTFGTDGIQGRHIAEYTEQRRPKVGMLPNYYLWGGV